MVGFWLGPLVGQLFFALQELFELLLVEFLQLLGEAAAVVDPLAHALFQGTGDIQQSAATVQPGGQIQGAVQLAVLAATSGLAAGAGTFNQGAAQEGLLGD
jgi:hypothetical protein